MIVLLYTPDIYYFLVISNDEVNNVLIVIINSKDIYEFECRATRTSDKSEGMIRCHGGVSIPR